MDHQFEMHKMLGVVTHTFHPSTREAQSFNQKKCGSVMTNCIFKVHFELHQDEARCHLLPRHAILSVSVRPSTSGGRMEGLVT